MKTESMKVEVVPSGCVFRFPGESAYLMKTDEVGPDRFNAVCLNGHDHRYVPGGVYRVDPAAECIAQSDGCGLSSEATCWLGF